MAELNIAGYQDNRITGQQDKKVEKVENLSNLSSPDTVSASVAEILSTLAEKLETANQRIVRLEEIATGLVVPPAAELTLTGSNDELRMTNDELAAAFNIQHSTFNILSPATIGGNLTIGLLTINDLNASINSMGETLKLQSLGLTNIELMAGKITIDTSGNIKTVGEITAEKVKAEEVETKRLCIEDICVTRDELKRLLEKSNF